MCVIREGSVASDLDPSLSASKAIHHNTYKKPQMPTLRWDSLLSPVPCSSQSLAQLNEAGKLKKKFRHQSLTAYGKSACWEMGTNGEKLGSRTESGRLLC